MNRIVPALVSLSLLSVSAVTFADDAKPYKDGPVSDVSFIRTKPGRSEDYMKFLAGTYKKEMEAYKAAGLITDYAVFTVEPRTPNDPDLILTVTYANMAALDKTEEFEAIDKKVLGSMEDQSKAMIGRGPMRDVLGSELIRQQILK